MKKLQTKKAPEAVGPYEQAIVANNFVFCSGQIGFDPQTGKLVEGIEKQTHQVLKNLQAVLEKAACDFTHVIKTTIFLTDMNDFATVNSIYAEYFTDHKPARSTVEVSHLPKGARIEIEVIAVLLINP